MSDAAFVGSVPQFYDRFLGPALFAPYAADMARRLADVTGPVLEVAAGTGIVTAALDRTLPASARIIATDLNAAMLEQAQGKGGWSGRVAWQTADGQALPFEAGAFEAVVCQFGVMFFPDRAAGFGEARRVLRAGGRYVFNVWDSLAHNVDARITQDTVAALFPSDPPGFLARTPFGYSDRDRIRSDLTAAGFDDIAIEAVPLNGRAESAAVVAQGYCQGSPLSAEIDRHGPKAVARATAAVTEALRARFGEGAFDTELQALVVTARP